jgi:beta-N-acetylhexosaminidase
MFGPLVIDLLGTTLQPEEQELIAHPLVGGVIFFARNYESPHQIQQLVRSIRQVQDKPLLIMVDQEGGRVQRFREGFTRIPPAAVYGQEAELSKALRFAEAGGYVMASELLAQGVDLSLAPVIDINKGLSSVIGDRAFHSEIAMAIQLAEAYIKGMRQAGMAATVKHFPGHGSVALDSHLELPIDQRSWQEIEESDLQPFLYFIQHNIPAIMTAHILFPQIDKLPVSFSYHWLTEILRQKLNYQGIIMSDDLDMKGADVMGDYADRMQAARAAGCDIILLCNNRSAVIQVLDRTPSNAKLLGIEKFEQLRGKFSMGTLSENTLWQQSRALLQQKTVLT